MGGMRALAFAAAAFVLQACANTADVASPPPPDPRTQMQALELRIFEIVQDERRRIDPGARALALNSELVGVARSHSADMAAKNYLAHKGPDGSTSAGIIMDRDAQFQGLLGENIAEEHFVLGYALDVDGTARRFVDLWLGSEKHRENLSFARYDRSGVGAAVSGDTIYVTQLFATDMGLSPPPYDPGSAKNPDAGAANGAPGQRPPG